MHFWNLHWCTSTHIFDTKCVFDPCRPTKMCIWLLLLTFLLLTVIQEIFACRKFSRISGNSQNFPARNYYQHTVGLFTFHLVFTEWKSDIPPLESSGALKIKKFTKGLPTSRIREIFMSWNFPVLQYIWDHLFGPNRRPFGRTCNPYVLTS